MDIQNEREGEVGVEGKGRKIFQTRIDRAASGVDFVSVISATQQRARSIKHLVIRDVELLACLGARPQGCLSF